MCNPVVQNKVKRPYVEIPHLAEFISSLFIDRITVAATGIAPDLRYRPGIHQGKNDMATNLVSCNPAAPDIPYSVSQRIAEYITSLSYSSLPESVCETAKLLILDTLAVAWAGTSAPGSESVYDLVIEEGGRSDGTVWGYGSKLPAASAAFINSMFSVALDYDSFNTVHADAVVLPAALAIAQRERVTGKEFLTAYVTGSDLCSRFGGAITGQHKGWSNTSIFGVFGAAIAAAKLLKLDAKAIRHAMGIALSQAAGTQQANIEQTLSKRIQPAFASRAGVWSALLAARGITAPREALEGTFGLYELYQASDSRKILEGLGHRFELKNTMMKKYPICACGHAALEAAMALIHEYDLKPDEVTAIEVTHSPFMHRLVGAPFEARDDPQVTAQNSVQYAIASALLRRRVGIAEIQDAAVRDPRIRQITARIAIVIDQENKGLEIPATVTMNTRQHGTLRRHVDKFPWGPDDPASKQALNAKFEDCFTYGTTRLTPARVKTLFERTANIEHIRDMSTFFTDIC